MSQQRSMPKDYGPIMAEAEKQGCTVEKTKRNGHYKIVCPRGGTVICASSPHNPYRDIRNLRSLLRQNGVKV